VAGKPAWTNSVAASVRTNDLKRRMARDADIVRGLVVARPPVPLRPISEDLTTTTSSLVLDATQSDSKDGIRTQVQIVSIVNLTLPPNPSSSPVIDAATQSKNVASAILPTPSNSPVIDLATQPNPSFSGATKVSRVIEVGTTGHLQLQNANNCKRPRRHGKR
jgi:hypothetical protein